jgi:hypothetical protein
MYGNSSHVTERRQNSGSNKQQQQKAENFAQSSELVAANARIASLEDLVKKLLSNNNNKNENSDNDPIALLNSRLDRLESLVHSLADRLDNNITTNNTSSQQQQSIPTANRWGCPPAGVLFRAINDAVSNSELVSKKSKSAVLERLPEDVDEKDAVKELAEQCGLLGEIDLENVHRHPKEKKNDKNRIVKIPFTNNQSRNQFLFKFRPALHKTDFPKNLSVRRDMLPMELSTLYDLRREAYHLNKAANAFKYVVVDLEIRTLPKPKPFTSG